MAADDVMVTDLGLQIVAKRIAGQGTEPIYIHWGKGTTANAAAETTLGLWSTAENSVLGTSTYITTNTTLDTYQVTGTITAASSQAITEVGLFDSASGGTNVLFMRGMFDPINVNIGDSIAFTIKTVFDQA